MSKQAIQDIADMFRAVDAKKHQEPTPDTPKPKAKKEKKVKKSGKDPQYRNICFTLNNYTDEDHKAVLGMTCKYMIVGEEVGGEKGIPHLQGYMEFASSTRFSTIKKSMPKAHIERRYGNAKQAIDYCKKEGKFVEIGSRSEQGKRTDLDEVADMVKSGASSAAIAEVYPKSYILHGNGIERLRTMKYTDRSGPPCVTWLWGLTGTGKTRTAVESHSDYYMKDSTMWWNGYEQQTAIIIDDFDGRWPFRDFLKLLDRYPYQGQCKGGYVKINSPYIYITCEFPPEKFWRGNELAQVTRRLTTVTEMPPQNSAAKVYKDTNIVSKEEIVGSSRLPLLCSEQSHHSAAAEVAGNTIQPLLAPQKPEPSYAGLSVRDLLGII